MNHQLFQIKGVPYEFQEILANTAVILELFMCYEKEFVIKGLRYVFLYTNIKL